MRICGSAEPELQFEFAAPRSRSRKKYFRLRNTGSGQCYINKTVLVSGTYFGEKYYTQQRLHFHILEVQIHQFYKASASDTARNQIIDRLKPIQLPSFESVGILAFCFFIHPNTSLPAPISILCKCYFFTTCSQCCGTMTFWGGSGSGSADPCLLIMDPDPGSGFCTFRH